MVRLKAEPAKANRINQPCDGVSARYSAYWTKIQDGPDYRHIAYTKECFWIEADATITANRR